MNGPRVLLADEPTGNLAVHQGREVLQLFQDLHASGRTVVLITHDPSVAATAQRQVHILDGRIVSGAAPAVIAGPVPATVGAVPAGEGAMPA